MEADSCCDMKLEARTAGRDVLQTSPGLGSLQVLRIVLFEALEDDVDRVFRRLNAVDKFAA